MTCSGNGSSTDTDQDGANYSNGLRSGQLTDEQQARITEINKNEMKKKIKNKKVARRLVEMAASKEGMMNIWDVYKKSEDTTNEVVYEPISEEKVENFNMYVDTCLVHMIPRTIWNKYHMNKSLTDLFTIADEAFAMLILENISPDLNNGFNEIDQDNYEGLINVWSDRKDARPKYTKSGRDTQGKMRGWRYEGILRYNDLIRDVVKWRKEKELRKFTEIELRKRYRMANDEAEANEVDLNKALNSTVLEEMERIEPIDLLEGIPWEEV